MAKSLMIQGTGSGAGKSMIVTALCRIFRDMGINVSPFKAQNMALNSYITADGGEIGRAQALQAEAAMIEPTVDMNPVLLKASGEMGSQVIIHGKVHSTMKAKEYYSFKKEAWEAVKASYDVLSQKYEFIIMEGAGSPAEINLMDVDIVNMAAAKYAKAPVLLVGDIDKGGVFASLYGTLKLLGKDSKHIKAFVINKFRGDLEILKPGLEMIKDRTGKPVIGVLPYMNIGLPEEDGLALYRGNRPEVSEQESGVKKIKVVVVRLQYISNFTDFDPFLYEPDIELIYSRNPADIENSDMVIIPGSKNTVNDLLFLKANHLDESIKKAYANGIQIIGICGGYQILGKKIYDPYCVESPYREIEGIGLLNIETTFQKSKTTCRVEAKLVDSSWLIAHSNKNNPYELSAISGEPLKGYEIHMGESKGDIGIFKIKRITSALSHCRTVELMDGSKNGNCWGTYIHGIFENDLFRRGIINETRKHKGLPPVGSMVRYSAIKDAAINELANVVRENIDIGFIKRIAKL